jgi:hypothetical protein
MGPVPTLLVVKLIDGLRARSEISRGEDIFGGTVQGLRPSVVTKRASCSPLVPASFPFEPFGLNYKKHAGGWEGGKDWPGPRSRCFS